MRRRPHLDPHHQPRRVAGAAALFSIALCVAGCGGAGGSKEAPETLTIAVNAPFTGAPYVANAIAQGVELGVQTGTKDGVISIGDKTYRIRVQKLDNELSPGRALRNVRRAIDEHALAVIDEGTGADASWKPADDAKLPIGIVYQGGSSLVDPVKRPNVFRIAPTDSGLAYRLGEYLDPEGASRRADDGRHRLRPPGSGGARQGFRAGPEERRRADRPPREPDRPLAAGAACEARRRGRAARVGARAGGRRRALRGPRPRLERAGVHDAGRAPTRSCASSSPTIPSGSTA